MSIRRTDTAFGVPDMPIDKPIMLDALELARILPVKEKKYSVTMVFGPTAQGEFTMAGRQTVFVRLHYCDGDGAGHWCTWCDTKETWDKTRPDFNNFERITAYEILNRVVDLYGSHSGGLVALDKTLWVTISGGNPAMQMDDELVDKLGRHFKLQIETQGTIHKPCMDRCQRIVVSPKLPSSGMNPLSSAMLRKWAGMPNVGFKYVVFNETDFWEADRQHSLLRDSYGFKGDFGLQAGTPVDGDVVSVMTASYKWLTEFWLASGVMRDAVCLPQIHTMFGGRDKGK